jgi:DNA-binding response OmpR family regulator
MHNSSQGYEDSSSDKVLILEDDRVTAKLIMHTLSNKGLDVLAVESQEKFVNAIESYCPQLIILDNVPNFSCVQSCMLARSRPSTMLTPIIIYSGMEDESTMVSLLSDGADRVISKKFSPTFLAAEIQALLRLSGSKNEKSKESVAINELRLDPRRNQAFLANEELKLTQSEFKVLYILARCAENVVSRERIIAFLHRDGFQASDRLVDVFVLRLRRKLANWQGRIITVRCVGYQLAG